MTENLSVSVILFVTVYLLCVNSVFADDRTEAMDRELDCVADHVKSGLGWDEVCSTSPEAKRQRLVAKSLDAMADEHTAMARDMNQQTIEGITQAHGEYADAAKSVDDFVAEQRVYEEFDGVDREQDAVQTVEAPSVAQQPAPAVQKSNLPAEEEDVDFMPKPVAKHDSVTEDENSWFTNLNGKTRKPESFRGRTHSFDTNFQYFFYKYREPEVVKHTAAWQGFEGQYDYRPPQGAFLYNPFISTFTLNGMYTWGDHDYNAIASNGDVLSDKGIPGKMFDGRVLVGKDYYGTPTSRITPYVGFGVRQLVDKSGGRVISVGGSNYLGYDRKQTFYYLPVGFSAELQSPKPDGIDIGVNGEVDIFYKGYQNSHLTDMDELSGVSNEDGTFPQNRGIGIRASVKFIKHFPTMDFYVEPFVRYWHIKQSKVLLLDVLGSQGFFVEPENNTLEAGSKMGIRF
jgi:hypothetical protein